MHRGGSSLRLHVATQSLFCSLPLIRSGSGSSIGIVVSTSRRHYTGLNGEPFVSAFPLTQQQTGPSSSLTSSSPTQTTTAPQPPPPLFDACFVLNLDRRTDRWRHTLRQIQRHRLANFVRTPTAASKLTSSEAAVASGCGGGDEGRGFVELFEGGRIQRVSGVDGIALCCGDDASAEGSVAAAVSKGSGEAISSRKLQRLVASGVLTPDAARRLATIRNSDRLFGMDLTPGGVGCALGHMRIWEMIAATATTTSTSSSDCSNDDSNTSAALSQASATTKSTAGAGSSSGGAPTGDTFGAASAFLNGAKKNFLILEDDVEFSPNFFRTLRARLANVPADYEVLYFGGLDLLSAGRPPRPFLRCGNNNDNSNSSGGDASGSGVRFAYAGHRELTAYVIRDASVAARMLAMSRPMQWQIDTHITERTIPCPLTYNSDGAGGGGGQKVPFSSSSSSSIEVIADPLSYVLQPSLAIQVTAFGTDVQKQPSQNAALEDASRRLREFVAGGTSVR